MPDPVRITQTFGLTGIHNVDNSIIWNIVGIIGDWDSGIGNLGLILAIYPGIFYNDRHISV